MTQNRINSKSIISQIVTASTSSVITCSTALPYDDTIPQSGEGNEVITASITPVSTTSTLEIQFTAMATKDSTSGNITCALFQDSTANALIATGLGSQSTEVQHLCLKYFMSSGTTSSTTFKIRVGNSANTCYVNGDPTGAQLFGGLTLALLTIIEYK